MENRSRNLSLLVFFILLGFFLARLVLSRREASVVVAPPEASTPAPAPTPAPVARKPEPAPKPGKKIANVPRKDDADDENTVPFRVENGVAIAYGDIILGTPDDAEVKEGFADVAPPQLWDRPEIPYSIHADLPRPQRVEQAVQYFNRNTSVRFIPYQGQQDVVVFEPGDEHCYSLLGRAGGAQPIRLAPNCRWHEIVHEMMHALGFVHEQSRRDRDQFVQILWDNIEEKYKQQFALVPDSFMRAVRDTPFDYSSIMLYRSDMFQKNPGLQTMKSLGQLPISPVMEGLSDGDIERLRRLYH